MGIYRFVLTILWIIICSSIGVFFRYYFGTSVLGALPAVILSLPCFYVVRLIWSGRFDIRKKSSNPKPTGGFNGSNIASQTVFKTTDGFSSSVSVPSTRIKTYVECPACGLMIAKGRSSCDCGYDLTPPSKKFLKKFFRIFLPVVFCVGLAVGGFFAGRYSMQPEIDTSFQNGRNEGYTAGYNIGHIAGYKKGRTEGYNRGLDIGKERGFEEGLASTSRVYYVNGNSIYHESINCTLFPVGQIKISTAYESRNLGKRPCIFCCSK